MPLTMGVEITDNTKRAKAIRRRMVRGVAGLSSMAKKKTRPAQSWRRGNTVSDYNYGEKDSDGKKAEEGMPGDCGSLVEGSAKSRRC